MNLIYQITSIEKDIFKGLENLNELDLGSNQITSIYKDAFKDLNNLTKIDLSHNRLKDMLTFNGIRYSHIPSAIKEINCSNNRIVKFNAKSLKVIEDCILDFRNNIDTDDILMVYDFLTGIAKYLKLMTLKIWKKLEI